jgi:hypothetical protein
MKTPIEAEQIRQAALRGVYVPSSTTAKPVEPPKPSVGEELVLALTQGIADLENGVPLKATQYTNGERVTGTFTHGQFSVAKPPADAEQVERVKAAIIKELAGDNQHSARVYNTMATDLARAAIAAMGGGKRWGVFRVKRKVWIGCAPINNNDFVTTDHMAALLMCDLMSKRYPNERYEVREYVEQEKAKTAEEIADECLAPIDIKEKHRRVTVAIENARKQNPS